LRTKVRFFKIIYTIFITNKHLSEFSYKNKDYVLLYDEAVDYYSAPDLLNYIEKESKKSSISKQLEKIAENVSEDDNHIIVIAR
jgi:hypothetical protein